MTIITATATKETLESKAGIAFTRKTETSPLTIKIVREEGLFHESELKAGMIVDSINGTPMTWCSPKDAADALRTTEGEVTISALVAKATATKETKETKCGISLKNSTTMEGMFISKINDESLFVGSELKEGLRVLFVNGQECPSKTKSAIQLVKDAEGELTIVAVDDEMVKPEEEEAAAPEAAAPVDPEPVEEKKEEHEEEEEETPKEDDDKEEQSKDRDLPVDDDAVESDKKGLLDQVFSACIC